MRAHLEGAALRGREPAVAKRAKKQNFGAGKRGRTHLKLTFWEAWYKSVNFGLGTDLGGAALDLEGQIVFFAYLDLYHKPPDSDQRQYKSRT